MSAYPPPVEDLPIFNPAVFIVKDTALTIAEGEKYFLKYPQAQGTQGFTDINVGGIATIEDVNADTLEVAGNADLNGNLDVAGVITGQTITTINGRLDVIEEELGEGVVHIDGAETITGNKTLSGTTTFTGNIIADAKTITPTELGYIDGATSNIQQQINDINTGIPGDNIVHIAGAEEITGVKTFNALPETALNAQTDNQLTRKKYVDDEIDLAILDLIDAAPSTLNTLNELAAALNDDPDFAVSIATDLGAKANDTAVVHLTGNESIAGVKTFTSLPVSAFNPTTDNQLTRKKYVDDGLVLKANDTAVVHITGNESIAGVKTFTSLPVSAFNPTTDNQLTRKKYVDAETTARENADTTLQNNIDAEENARIAGDELKVNKSGDTMTGDLTTPLLRTSELRCSPYTANYLNYINMFSGTNQQSWLRFRCSGNTPVGETGIMFGRFDNNNYLMRNADGTLKINWSNTNAATERTNAGATASGTEIFSLTTGGDLGITGNLSVGGDITLSGNEIKSNDNQLDIYPNGGSANSTGWIELRSTGTKIAGKDIIFNTDTDSSDYGLPRMTITQNGDVDITNALSVGGDIKKEGTSGNYLRTTWNSGVSQFEVEYPTGTGLFFNNVLSTPSLRLLDTKVQVYNGLEVVNGDTTMTGDLSVSGNTTVDGDATVGGLLTLNNSLTFSTEQGQINVPAGTGAQSFFDIAIGTVSPNTDYTFRIKTDTSILRSNLSVVGDTTMTGGLTAVGAVQANEFIITNSTGSSTTRLGYQTLGGNEGVFIGYRAGALNNSVNNTAVGYESMYSSAGGIYATCLGRKAGYHNRGSYNQFIGINAGYGFSTDKIIGGDNIGFGVSSLGFLTTGDKNVCVGNNTGLYATTGAQNTAIGHNAMRGLSTSSLMTGRYNVAVGLNSQIYNSSGDFNVSVGYESMNGSAMTITGDYNNAIGRRSLFRLTTGAFNTAIGYQSMGEDNAGVSGSNNVCLGYRSGYKITSAENNLCLGHSSGENNTGSNNVFVGAYSGRDTSSVNHRLGIGYDAQPTQEKEILITTGAADKNQFQMLTNGMKWIFGGTTKMLMEIVNSVATYNFYGYLKVWNGTINTTGWYEVDDNPLINVSFCAYQASANPSANSYINLHFLHPYVDSQSVAGIANVSLSHRASGNAIYTACFPYRFKLSAIVLMYDTDSNTNSTNIRVQVNSSADGNGTLTTYTISSIAKTSSQRTQVIKNFTDIDVYSGCFKAQISHSTSTSPETSVYFYGYQY